MFSKILKEKRKELGLTQQEVANKLNVTRQTISNWEVGKSYPDIPTLIEISNFYNLSLDYMLKGDEQFMEKVKKDTKLFKNLKKEGNNMTKSYANRGMLISAITFFAFFLLSLFTSNWKFLFSAGGTVIIFFYYLAIRLKINSKNIN